MFTLIIIMMLATKYNIQLHVNVKKPSLNSLLKGNILNKKLTLNFKKLIIN
jgi:hypothetical protein